MRQLLVLIMGCFMAVTAYSLIPISTVPVYAKHADLNNIANPYQDVVNERVKLDQKKPRKQHERSREEHDKSNLEDTKITNPKK